MKVLKKNRLKWLAGALVMVCFVGSYCLGRFVVLPGFTALERKQAAENLERCLDAVSREIHYLDNQCGDWAMWDDTYEFVHEPNDRYIQSNLAWATLEGETGLNLICMCDTEERVVWVEAYDSARGGQIDLDLLPTEGEDADCLFGDRSPGEPLAGLVLTEMGPMLVSARPILTSEGEGPSPEKAA